MSLKSKNMLSLNEIVKFGKYKFDIQTESRGYKIVSELFHNGKVIKKVEKDSFEAFNMKMEIHSLHNIMKKLLFEKLNQKKRNNTNKSLLLFNQPDIKKKILSLLDINDDMLRFSLLKNEEVEIISMDKNYCGNCMVKDLIEELNKLNMGRFGKVNIFLLSFGEKDESDGLIYLRENGNHIVFVVSQIKFSVLRHTVIKGKNELTQILSNLNNIKK